MDIILSNMFSVICKLYNNRMIEMSARNVNRRFGSESKMETKKMYEI